MGRLGISTLVYSKAFISKAWAVRASMEEYERRGFFQFLYVTACGHAESILCNYLKAVLFLPLLTIRSATQFPVRVHTVDGIEHVISTEPEHRALQRVLQSTIDDIDRAPLARLEKLHETIVGKTIHDIIGSNRYDDLRGLVSVRNLLAHGRELYVNINFSDQADLRVDLSFEQHPLENAIKSLRQANLIGREDKTRMTPDELMGAIYKDEVVVHFWNASA